MSERPKGLDLYAYYGVARDRAVPKIGSYICNMPTHMTFGKYQTQQPHLVLETIREVLADCPRAPHMIRERVSLSDPNRHGRRKPIIFLHDTADRLLHLQEEMTQEVQRHRHTRVHGWSRFSETRRPHVTIDYALDDPYVPEQFTVDHIVVTSGERVGTQHWHNFVYDVIPLS